MVVVWDFRSHQQYHSHTVRDSETPKTTSETSLFWPNGVVRGTCWSSMGGWGYLELMAVMFCYLLGQWLNFKLFGITYLVGKRKFKLFFQGPLAK